MPFENTYLMLLYFCNKKKKKISFKKNVDIISFSSCENTEKSDDTYDINRYPFNKKEIILQ